MKKAFTITELIIVIAVIGVLAAILIVALPKVIASANAKSALADAKNALTQTVISTVETKALLPDTLFVVNKAGEEYVFGYMAHFTRLIDCANNPFAEGSAQISDLLSAGVIKESNTPSEITDRVQDLSDNVRVFSGYSLEAIDEQLIISESNVKILLNSTHKLTAEALPYNAHEIVWSSSNEKVATIADGVVSAVSEGSATIKAQSGTLSAECSVTVCTYTEFSGNFSALKTLVEDKSENYLFLKIKDEGASIYSNNESLFPITIPNGKTVHIDMNSSDISYGSSGEGPDAKISSVLYNDGGTLYLESTGTYSQGAINGSNNGTNTLVNANGGKVFVHANIKFSGNRRVEDPQNAVILNKSAGSILFDSAEAGGTIGDNGYLLCNCEDAVLSMINCNFNGINLNSHIIYNAGTIDTISNCNISAVSGTAIENAGTISSISGGKFVVSNMLDAEYSAYDYAYVIHNLAGGHIGTISGGEFIVESIVPTDKQYVFAFKSGTGFESITGGTFRGVRGEIYYAGDYSQCVSGNGISGGTFGHEVPNALIATGCKCVYDSKNSMYTVR